MFKAIVLACSLSAPENCIELHDFRGPWKSYEACVERVHEMAQDVGKLPGDLLAKSYKCLPLRKGMLS